MRSTARNIWWRLPVNRRRAQVAQFGRANAVTCLHTQTGVCSLRMRPGDTRKSCWKVCRSCGLWIACNC